ncbi:MAG: hypothetical protein RLZZ262_1477 [Bacteroidota bacterium]|jgi:hypothetical protein
MKNFLRWTCLFAAFVFSNAAIAQTNSDSKPSPFGLGSNLVTYNFGYGNSMLHEIKVDHFFRDNISLLYAARYSRPVIRQHSSDAEFTAPLGASIGVGMGFMLGGGSACGYLDPDVFFGVFMYSCMIPDGIAFHFYPSEKIDISPYINVTGLTIASRNNETGFYYTPSAGLRCFYAPTENVVLSLEQQVLVRPENTYAANLSLGIGLHF